MRIATSSPHILLARLSSIGDVVHGIPVLNALRSHFPNSEISWLVESPSAEILAGHEALDRLLVLPKRWWRSIRRMRRLHRQLRSLRFDLAIDLQGLLRSALTIRFVGIPLRIGFGDVDGREMSRWLNNELVTPTRQHIIDRNLELLRPLGIDKPAVRFNMPQDNEADLLAERYLQFHHILHGFAVINPGAGWPSRLWEMKRFGRVARHLGQQHGLPTVVVWGNKHERRWAAQIVQQSDGYALQAPTTTLRELAALARRANLFISSDTGPLHLAAAVGTPCVGLYGPVPAERNGPYGNRHINLQKARPASSRFYRRQRRSSNELMLAISADDVISACDALLQRPRREAMPISANPRNIGGGKARNARSTPHVCQG